MQGVLTDTIKQWNGGENDRSIKSQGIRLFTHAWKNILAFVDAE